MPYTEIVSYIYQQKGLTIGLVSTVITGAHHVRQRTFVARNFVWDAILNLSISWAMWEIVQPLDFETWQKYALVATIAFKGSDIINMLSNSRVLVLAVGAIVFKDKKSFDNLIGAYTSVDGKRTPKTEDFSTDKGWSDDGRNYTNYTNYTNHTNHTNHTDQWGDSDTVDRYTRKQSGIKSPPPSEDGY